MALMDFLLLFSTTWTDTQTLLLFFVVFLLVFGHVKNRRPKNFPPGPTPLPFLGNFFSLDHNQLHVQLTKLSDKYGNIYSLQLGGIHFVVVNSYTMVKEALVDQAETFSDRPPNAIFQKINKCQGIAFNNGYSWKQQRRFTLSTLRNFGLGKRNLESSITEEFNFLRQAIINMKGEPFDPHYVINNAVSNIICSLVFGRRFEYTDKRFLNMLDLMSKSLKLEGSLWAQRKDDQEAGFHSEGLCYTVLDLFMAGTETTSTTLLWAFIYMMKYPEIQEKVQAEIDRVIGHSRRPSMADRPNMPYTDAVIHEIQRMGNIVPLNIPRITNKHTTLGGYYIPKGTLVIPNLTSVLFDETRWKSLHSFDPQNFLNTQGEFVKPDAFLPFSAGKRVCPGESLARMELFIFFTSLLQAFTLSSPAGTKPSLDFEFGMTLCPKPFRINASPRIQSLSQKD